MDRIDCLILALRAYGVYLIVNGLLTVPDLLTMSRMTRGGADEDLLMLSGAKMVMTIVIGIFLFMAARGIARLGDAHGAGESQDRPSVGTAGR